MFSSPLPLGWSQKLDQGQFPTPFVEIAVGEGNRYYGQKDLSEIIYDSSGSLKSGLSRELSFAARIKSFGNLNRTISPVREGLLGGFGTKQTQSVNISLSDPDSEISALVEDEAWLNKTLTIFLGFSEEDDIFYCFSGKIVQVVVSLAETVLKAEE